jgi:hypothetical protein
MKELMSIKSIRTEYAVSFNKYLYEVPKILTFYSKEKQLLTLSIYDNLTLNHNVREGQTRNIFLPLSVQNKTVGNTPLFLT